MQLCPLSRSDGSEVKGHGLGPGLRRAGDHTQLSSHRVYSCHTDTNVKQFYIMG